jgi:hypothetical protein
MTAIPTAVPQHIYGFCIVLQDLRETSRRRRTLTITEQGMSALEILSPNNQALRHAGAEATSCVTACFVRELCHCVNTAWIRAFYGCPRHLQRRFYDIFRSAYAPKQHKHHALVICQSIFKDLGTLIKHSRACRSPECLGSSMIFCFATAQELTVPLVVRTFSAFRCYSFLNTCRACLPGRGFAMGVRSSRWVACANCHPFAAGNFERRSRFHGAFFSYALSTVLRASVWLQV